MRILNANNAAMVAGEMSQATTATAISAVESAVTADASVQTFNFPVTGQGVRIIEKEGEPWFVAKDVCDCLGLTNGRQAVTALDEDEKSTVRISDGTSPQGGNPNKTIISESGLYALVFRSTKPEARAFSKWVRSEILPAIRKTGGYIIARPEESPEALIARALFVAKDSLDRANAKLAEVQPKVEAFDTLLNTVGAYTLTEAAKHFEMSAQRLNSILRDENWLFKNAIDKQGKKIPTVNLPYQRIIAQGYAIVKTRAVKGGMKFTQTYIASRGITAIERLLRRRCDI